MTLSSFTVGLNQSHWITRSNGYPGPPAQSTVEFGDNTKSAGSDTRRSTYHSWDLGGVIPKHAVLDGAYVEFVPTQGNGADPQGDLDFTHVLALMYADGHWNRSAQNELHQAQGGGFLHAPAQTHVLWVRALNSADSEIADTMTDTSGAGTYSNFFLKLQSLGSTIEIPGGEDIKTVRVSMHRDHAPLPADPTLTMKIYTLYENGRQFALDTLVASSEPVAYSALSLTPTFSDIDFTFATAIPSQASSRWVGMMIEGEIFEQVYLGVQVYSLQHRGTSSQIAYPSGTAGSMVHASSLVDMAEANALEGYLDERSVPCLYPILSGTLITTPYSRFFGSIMSKTNCGPWWEGVPKTYGDASADEEFPNFVQTLQDWIDSDHYSPNDGKTWIGMMFDIAFPNNTIFRTAGTTHTSYDPHKLVLDWHPRRSAVRARSRALPRVAASSSRAFGRVAASSRARQRVDAPVASAGPRVRAGPGVAMMRVKAPSANAHSGV